VGICPAAWEESDSSDVADTDGLAAVRSGVCKTIARVALSIGASSGWVGAEYDRVSIGAECVSGSTG
jgi:hypothetical protein